MVIPEESNENWKVLELLGKSINIQLKYSYKFKDSLLFTI